MLLLRMVWCKQSCRRRFGTWQTEHRGSPGTWENPAIAPRRTPRPETPGHQLQAQAAHSSVWERKRTSDTEVSPNEGNEVRRDGVAGSHSVLIVPRKLANLTPDGASGGKRDVESWNRFWETRRMHRNSEDRVHETGTDSSVGETVARDGFHFARLSDGRRLAQGSVSGAHARMAPQAWME